MNASTQLTAAELSTGELVVAGRLVDASNATLFCELKLENELNEVRKVVYKPIAGERPLWDFPEGNLAGREVAAYLLSEFADFDLVPLTVMRDGPFGGLEMDLEERTQIQNLLADFESLDKILSPFINSEEVAALKSRLEMLSKEPRFPYPNPNWPAIPWPPV
ncbi:MAG: hypothetical protein EB030_00515 [Actinobacteria bacterium]|nr:hypothetical protein [Actinomycetota bacterium]